MFKNSLFLDYIGTAHEKALFNRGIGTVWGGGARPPSDNDHWGTYRSRGYKLRGQHVDPFSQVLLYMAML